jgi:hypothetical protein
MFARKKGKEHVKDKRQADEQEKMAEVKERKKGKSLLNSSVSLYDGKLK